MHLLVNNCDVSLNAVLDSALKSPHLAEEAKMKVIQRFGISKSDLEAKTSKKNDCDLD